MSPPLVPRDADWFLTAASGATPPARLPPWSTGNAVTPLVARQRVLRPPRGEVRDLRRGDCLFFTDWRATPTSCLCPEGPTVGGAVGRRRPPRGRRQGADVALAHREAVLQRGGEPPARRRRRRGGRRGAARPTRPPRRLAPPEAGGAARSRPRRRVRRRHRPVPRPPRRRPPPRRPAVPADGRGVRRPPAVARRPARDPRPGRGRARHDVPGALGGPAFRRHPQPARPACSDRLRRADISRRSRCPRRRRSPTRSGRARCRCCAPTRRSGRAPPTRRDGERTVARGFGKALHARGGWSTSRTSTCGPRTSPGCSATPCAPSPELHLVVVVPRHPDVDGRFALPPNQVGRVQAIAACRDAAPDRVHVFDLENHARHTGVRARQGRRVRRRLGLRGQRQPQPALVEPRQRAHRRRARRHAATRATPSIRRDAATAPGCSPATCGWSSCASTSTGRRATTPTCWIPTTRWRPWRRGGRPRPLAPRRPGRYAPARAVAHARPRTDAAPDAPLGDAALPRGLRPGRPFGCPTGGAGVGENQR